MAALNEIFGRFLQTGYMYVTHQHNVVSNEINYVIWSELYPVIGFGLNIFRIILYYQHVDVRDFCKTKCD